MIFDPAKQAGPFLLLEDARACIGAALLYRGFSANTTNAAELAAARDLLIETKKRSLGFEGVAGSKNRVLSKGAALAIVYNGDAMRGIKEDGETAYMIPKEGTQIFVDLLSVPAHAPHRDLAEKFINFMLDAKVGAKFANLYSTATANQAALEFVDPSLRQNPLVYPPPEVVSRLQYLRDLGDANKLYDELWTVIKSK
jgi:spermidine/putrescine transport system substrate-binding protein